jgi:hypothetical protein
MKIKHFYVSIRVGEYCLQKCVSFTAAEPSMVQYIGLLNLDITQNIIERACRVELVIKSQESPKLRFAEDCKEIVTTVKIEL